ELCGEVFSFLAEKGVLASDQVEDENRHQYRMDESDADCELAADRSGPKGPDALGKRYYQHFLGSWRLRLFDWSHRLVEMIKEAQHGSIGGVFRDREARQRHSRQNGSHFFVFMKCEQQASEA